MQWGPILGGLALGAFGYKGAKDQNVASAAQAQRQMDFQREMSNTAIQRRMADLKAGGLNPILAGKHEASTPGGAMAPMVNRAAVALQHASTAAQIKNIEAQTNLTNWKAVTAQGQSIPWQLALDVQDAVEGEGPLTQKIKEFQQELSSAREAFIRKSAETKSRVKEHGPQSKLHIPNKHTETDIPFKDRHPIAKKADIRSKRNTKFATRKINLIKSKHPRNRRRR
jgi:hypothetical protein